MFDLGPDESQWESNKKKLRYSELCNHEHIELYQELLLTLAYTYIVCVYYTVLKLPLYLHRCDQYRWVHKGTRTFDHGNYSVKKKTGAIDVAGIEKQTGDNSFKRLEYWGIGSSYLIHYLGDHNAFVPCAHRNSKKSTKPFVRSAPHIKERYSVIVKHEIVRDLPIMFKILQVTNKGPMMSAQKVYQQLVNEDEGAWA